MGDVDIFCEGLAGCFDSTDGLGHLVESISNFDGGDITSANKGVGDDKENEGKECEHMRENFGHVEFCVFTCVQAYDYGGNSCWRFRLR